MRGEAERLLAGERRLRGPWGEHEPSRSRKSDPATAAEANHLEHRFPWEESCRGVQQRRGEERCHQRHRGETRGRQMRAKEAVVESGSESAYSEASGSQRGRAVASEPLLKATALSPSPYSGVYSLSGDPRDKVAELERSEWRVPEDGCWAVYSREIVSEKQARRYRRHELQKMRRFESVDTYEPDTTVYKDHLENRSQEPRGLIWMFVLVLGVLSSGVAICMISLLHVMTAIRYELLGFGLRGFTFNDPGRYPTVDQGDLGTSLGLNIARLFQGESIGLYGIRNKSYGKGYLLFIAFTVVTASLSSLLVALVPACRAAGLAEMMAYINGVRYQKMSSLLTLTTRLVVALLTVSSGACTGHYGTLMICGGQLGALLLARNRWFQCNSVQIISCFRNPRDRRNIIIIGAAAGLAAAFSVSIGGLMLIFELLTTVVAVRFALYVLVACLVSSLSMQTYFSYMSYFSIRDRHGDMVEGELLSQLMANFGSNVPLEDTVKMNILYFGPAIVLGLLCGLLAALFVRLSWLALFTRRCLEARTGRKWVRYVLPVAVTVVYVSLNYWVAVGFGSAGPMPVPESEPTATPQQAASSDGREAEEVPTNGLLHPCAPVPRTVVATRNISIIGYYGMNGFFCDAEPAPGAAVATSSASAAPSAPPRAKEQAVRVLHSYASLAFANADSTLQALLSVRTAGTFPPHVLAVFLVLYFVFAGLFSGISLCGDTLLPSLTVGALVGRLVGLLVFHAARAVDAGTYVWADPGVFALIGAGSFLGGTSGLTFSVCVILMESTKDFRHVLPLMVGITIAKKTAELWSHDMQTTHLEARAVPLLDFENQIHKFVMFDARHVMTTSVTTLETVCTLRRLLDVLMHCNHHGFPIESLRDRTFTGIILRQHLELVLWHFHYTGALTVCSYDLLRRIDDRLMREGCEGTLPPFEESWLDDRVDLSPYIDHSAFCILHTATLPRVYTLFRTLGLRHLTVVNASNRVVGIITRIDLVADCILDRVTQVDEERQAALRRLQLPSLPPDGLSAVNWRGTIDSTTPVRAADAALHRRNRGWVVCREENDDDVVEGAQCPQDDDRSPQAVELQQSGSEQMRRYGLFSTMHPDLNLITSLVHMKQQRQQHMADAIVSSAESAADRHAPRSALRDGNRKSEGRRRRSRTQRSRGGADNGLSDPELTQAPASSTTCLSPPESRSGPGCDTRRSLRVSATGAVAPLPRGSAAAGFPVAAVNPVDVKLPHRDRRPAHLPAEPDSGGVTHDAHPIVMPVPEREEVHPFHVPPRLDHHFVSSSVGSAILDSHLTYLDSDEDTALSMSATLPSGHVGSFLAGSR